jgi:hypothetical protein
MTTSALHPILMEDDEFVVNEFYYGKISFLSGRFAFLADVAPGCTSVHFTRAASVSDADILSYCDLLACDTILISDQPDRRSQIEAMSRNMRAQRRDLTVAAQSISYHDYWSSRSCPQVDIVIDIGQIMHDHDPDQMITRLASMTRRYLMVVAVVLPADTSHISGVRDGDVISAAALMADRQLAHAVVGTYAQKGIVLEDAPFQQHRPEAWNWHFTPDALCELGERAGLTRLHCVPVWSDIACAVLFERKHRRARA